MWVVPRLTGSADGLSTVAIISTEDQLVYDHGIRTLLGLLKDSGIEEEDSYYFPLGGKPESIFYALKHLRINFALVFASEEAKKLVRPVTFEERFGGMFGASTQRQHVTSFVPILLSERQSTTFLPGWILASFSGCRLTMRI